VTEQLLARLELKQVQSLRALPVDRLLAAYRAVWNAPPRQLWGFPARFSPLVDGRVIPEQPLAPATLALAAHVPVIIGSMREEMAGFTLAMNPQADRMTLAELPEQLRPFLGTATDNIVAGYRKIHPDFSPWDLYVLITADNPTRFNSIRIAEKRHALGRAPAFMYRVDWQAPVLGGRLKAPHGLDVPMAFRNVQEDASLNGGGADAVSLSNQISGAWVAFARTGQPGTPELAWPAYTPAQRATMLFDRKSRVESDPGRAERLLLEASLPKW
jgi:para-nitrobenzyl esterase